MADHGKIIVVGGGLGGLTLAIGLVREGFEVEVHEQAPELREVGAGLTLPVNAMRVFDAIGVWEKVRDVCALATGAAFVHYQTLEILTGSYSYSWNQRPTSPEQGGNTHRGQVHALLAAELATIAPGAICLNHRLKAVAQDEHGIVAEFENGDTTRGSLLVGADGIASATQTLLLGHSVPTVFTGVVAYRAIVPRTASLEPFLTGGRSVKYVGPGRGLNRYGIMDGSALNCVALVKTSAWTEEGWTHHCTREEFLELFADFHEDCRQVIQHAPEGHMFKWALRDRDPLPCWQSGRATLLGDAAHPMLPYMSQGACAAIEDAWVLIRCLKAYDDYDEAFKSYEANRLPRTSLLMRASRAQGEALNQDNPYDYPKLRPNRAPVVDYNPLSVHV